MPFFFTWELLLLRFSTTSSTFSCRFVLLWLLLRPLLQQLKISCGYNFSQQPPPAASGFLCSLSSSPAAASIFCSCGIYLYQKSTLSDTHMPVKPIGKKAISTISDAARCGSITIYASPSIGIHATTSSTSNRDTSPSVF
ncbi:hypothetical protein M9H77_07761 [Catharanthus roseus]|uniref:Uncharacterized protein n=1 Tax=Catharanthus roseus TaxID=4058 RepID=A0ACC0BW52_CATRO|nr:hypothetical protein M9H77_07761 [Catharanthus roseus]